MHGTDRCFGILDGAPVDIVVYDLAAAVQSIQVVHL